MEYLHLLGICHRDLKPENLLLDFRGNIKVVDFGLSNLYEGEDRLKTACGSPCYAAPEMLMGMQYNGLKTDLWSCGVVLYAMVCGYLPFEDPELAVLYKKIKSGRYDLPKNLPAKTKDLIIKMLQTDPNARLTI